MFQKVGALALESNASYFLPADLELLSGFGVSMADLVSLEEAGVLGSDRLMQAVTFSSEAEGYIRNQAVVGFLGPKIMLLALCISWNASLPERGGNCFKRYPCKATQVFCFHI